jgi:hypothetical protein
MLKYPIINNGLTGLNSIQDQFISHIQGVKVNYLTLINYSSLIREGIVCKNLPYKEKFQLLQIVSIYIAIFCAIKWIFLHYTK